MTTMTRARVRSPYRVGDTVTGTTYVDPADRGHETPERVTGEVVQVGSGWVGVDADAVYLWIRLRNGRERQVLMSGAEKTGP
ncbi:hypothetical protein ACFXPI_04510 [Streptomyces sp. NPDC059104]|uniref:hypothetical protein n=1 Tax=Streptomyces sp. NPDC059104 TaxID=3346729 RepID=UPI00368D8B3F